MCVRPDLFNKNNIYSSFGSEVSNEVGFIVVLNAECFTLNIYIIFGYAVFFM